MVGEQTGAIQVVVRNAGGKPTGIVALSLAGVAATSFAIVPTGAANDCDGAVLQPEATCRAQVRFQPSEAGQRVARLDISAAPGGTVSIELAGTGLTHGNLAITSGGILDFGTREITTMSATQTVTVINNGESTTAALTTMLGDPSNYTKVNDGCDGIALSAQQSCTVQLRFNPMVLGPLPTQLAIRESPTVGVSAAANGMGSARLRVNKTGIGSVSSDPPGIECGHDCAMETVMFTESPVMLHTSSWAGYVVEAWRDACATSQSSSCTVHLTDPLNIASVTMRAPSCVGLTNTCGPGSNADCCASSLVPGGSFYRSYDATSLYDDMSYPGSSPFVCVNA
jgi:hypothetical protein